jgi:DNA adenine methylase
MNIHASPLRYPGGKQAVASLLADLLPEDQGMIIDPFCGGGSLTFECRRRKLSSFHAMTDLNFELIAFWNVASDPLQCPALMEALNRIHSQGTASNRELFYNWKQVDVTNDSISSRAVRFFFLNRFSFSGSTESGGCSKGDRFTKNSIEALRTIPKALDDVLIRCMDYREAIEIKQPVSNGRWSKFLLLDPPYYTAKSLYGKDGDLHDTFDHQELAKVLAATKHRFLMTYDDCPEIRALYAGNYMMELPMVYGMRSKKNKRVSELIIANYPLKKSQLELNLEVKA